VSETALCLNGLGHILGIAVNLFLCGFRSEVSHRAQFLVLCSLAFISTINMSTINISWPQLSFLCWGHADLHSIQAGSICGCVSSLQRYLWD